MNLVVDIGNTRAKCALFEDGTILKLETVDHNDLEGKIKELLKDHPKIQQAIVSDVSGLLSSMSMDIFQGLEPHILTSQSKVPFNNTYATPSTLGVDRLALATAAFGSYTKKNVLVFDLGTCMTYDLIDQDGNYLGGAISPGLMMRYRAMHNQTGKLPLLEPGGFDLEIGDTTANSMHVGAFSGMRYEINGVINTYRASHKDLTVILTGGDSHFFANHLNYSIFVNQNFLLEGLNYLLEYNKR